MCSDKQWYSSQPVGEKEQREKKTDSLLQMFLLKKHGLYEVYIE